MNGPVTAHVKVVPLTACGQQADFCKGAQLGVDAYLTKPFHPDEVVQLSGGWPANRAVSRAPGNHRAVPAVPSAVTIGGRAVAALRLPSLQTAKVGMASRTPSRSAKPGAKTGAKPAGKGGGPGAGRRRTPPPKPPRHISWGVVVMGLVVALFAGGIIAYAVIQKSGTTHAAASASLSTSPPPWPRPVDTAELVTTAGVPVNQASETVHYHAHLDVINNGQPVTVPAEIGLDQTVGSSLHTHDTSGVIHMETEKPYQFKLGQFFTEWGVKLTKDQVGGLVNGSGGKTLRVYVDGKPYAGDPSAIALKQHMEIAVVYGSPSQQVKVPSSYQFPQGE